MQDGKSGIAEWQMTLEKTFGGARGNVGTIIQSLYEQEYRNAQLTMNKSTGFMTLMQGFFDFALLTLAEVQAHPVVLNVYNIAFVVAALRRMRVGLFAYERGYYFDAASQLRAIFENTMYVGAVFRGLCWFDELYSFVKTVDLATIAPDALRKMQHRHVQNVNKRVTCLMYGEDSELSPDEQARIRFFLTMQHMHVHRGESNVLFFIAEMMQDGKVPEIAPKFDLERASIYANTAACAAWTLHRILQYLSEPGRNSPTWHEQWSVLEKAFRFWVVSWESPFAGPFIRLMDSSFTFDADTALCQLRKA